MANKQQSPTPQKQKDFFISYRGSDRTWAEWIAWQLEAAGYSTIIQAWDFRPGSSFPVLINDALLKAERVLCVLSSEYFTSPYTQAEWTSAWRVDPTGERGILLPVLVRSSEIKGLLGNVISIDLSEMESTSEEARERLLAGVKRERDKPHRAPLYPGNGPHFPGAYPAMWMVPFRRNRLFTGREQVLNQLRTLAKKGTTVALTQAISGLGGIGKTQTAVEYAYRYRDQYQAVLWLQATSEQTIVSSYQQLATMLQVPEQQAQETEQVIAGVKQWFRTHGHWLLIVDNADELKMGASYLPTGNGQIVLTTRAQAVGQLAQAVQLEEMGSDEGTLLLLRRARVLENDTPIEQASEMNQKVARELCKELGGLPLALDQAGAYIEETQSSLVDYQTLYKTQRAEVLRERGGLVPDHPLPVATTWSLSFQQVEQQNPTAAEILCLCAFLAPNAIPESILTTGIEALGPLLQGLADNPLAFNKAVAVLGAYSLVRRDVTTHTLSLHRLVQAVLKDQMNEEDQRLWKRQVVLAVNAARPNVQDIEQWDVCEQWLPHAFICATWIEQEHLTEPEAAELLNAAGYYLDDRARYHEAEPILKQVLTICEQQLGAQSPETASNLNNLALLYMNQKKYTEAEPLLIRAKEICEQMLKAQHPATTQNLNDLASKSFNNLALLYMNQKKYAEAEPLYVRALTICEGQLGADHPNTALCLHNLGALYYHQKKYTETEPLMKRALAIREEQLGADHIDTAQSLNGLAALYMKQRKYTKARPLLKRALAIDEQRLGTEHPTTQTVQGNYTALL